MGWKPCQDSCTKYWFIVETITKIQVVKWSAPKIYFSKIYRYRPYSNSPFNIVFAVYWNEFCSCFRLPTTCRTKWTRLWATMNSLSSTDSINRCDPRTRIQWPPLYWITDNWISRLIESDLPGPDQTDTNIYNIHRLIESKSRFFASLQNFFENSLQIVIKMKL